MDGMVERAEVECMARFRPSERERLELQRMVRRAHRTLDWTTALIVGLCMLAAVVGVALMVL